MPEETGQQGRAGALDLQLTVPAEGELRAIAADLAAKVAEHLGAPADTAQSLGQRVSSLASELAASGADIAFDFRQSGPELVIQARCAGQRSEVRQPLPN